MDDGARDIDDRPDAISDKAGPDDTGPNRSDAGSDPAAPSKDGPSTLELLRQGSFPIPGPAPAAQPRERRPRDTGPSVEFFGDGMVSPGMSRKSYLPSSDIGDEPYELEEHLGPEYTIRHHLPEILTIIGAILFVIFATM